MGSENEILSEFEKMGKEIIFSAETGCWPDESLADAYPSSATAYRFLNSGGFIGKTKVIREILKDESFDIENFQQSN